MRATSSLLQPFRNELVQKIVGSYTIQGANYIFPLILLPYLAYTMGPTGLGKIAYAQSFAFWLAIPIEFGFNISATKLVSRKRMDRAALGEAVTTVATIKLTTAVIVVCLASALVARIPIFNVDTKLFVGSLLYALSFGLNLSWFYLGTERVKALLKIEAGTRLVTLIAVVSLAKHAGQEWAVLCIQGAIGLMGVLIAHLLLRSEISYQRPRVSVCVKMVRDSRSMFAFKAMESVYQMGGPFVLGLFASSHVVGVYSGGERIARAGLALILPLNRVFFPRMAFLMKESHQEAIRLFKRSLAMTLALGLTLSVALWLVAPYVVLLALGNRYEQSIHVLRILSGIIVVVGLKNVFGFQWTIVIDREREFNRLVLLSGVIAVAAMIILTPRYQEVGMAWSILLTEISLVISTIIYLLMSGRNPLARTPVRQRKSDTVK